MIFGGRDLRALCRQMGTPVSFAGVSIYPDGEAVKGMIDSPVQIKLLDQGIGGVETDLPELRLPFNAFKPMPRRGDVVTVTDRETGLQTAYRVNAPTAEDDGAFLAYSLNEVSR